MCKELLLQTIDTLSPSALELTEKLMSINSHSKNQSGIKEVVHEIKNELGILGFSSTRHSSTHYGDHLVSQNTAQGKPFLLVGHTDTAHPKESHFQSTTRSSNSISGPGGYDMKAGIAMGILALTALKKLNLLDSIPIKVFLAGDEEIGMPSSLELHSKVAKDCRSALVLESGRKDNLIVLSRKGVSLYKVIVRGKSAHSGNDFWSGKNAILHLTELLYNLAKISSTTSGTTLNVGKIQGGTSATIVPDYAEALFDVRAQSISEENIAQEFIHETLNLLSSPDFKVHLTKETRIPPMEKTKSSENLANSYIDIFSTLGETSSINKEIIGGASSASLISAIGTPTLDALGPYGKGAHTEEEFFSIDSFTIKAKALALFLLKESGAHPSYLE